MVKYKDKILCPECGKQTNQVIVENGIEHTHCFRCGHHDEPHKEKMKKDIDPNDLDSAALEARGIRKEIAEIYGVKVQFSPETREQVAYWFPRTKKGETTGYQVRDLPKSFRSVGDVKGCELFGQSISGSNGQLLLITEGNEDCLALKQILLDHGKNYRVVSVPNGSSSVKSIKENSEWLESFNTIILAVDQDTAGNALRDAICDVLTPGKVKVARLPSKDCNEALLKDQGDAVFRAIWNAKDAKPEEIVDIEEIYREAITPVERGQDWPWPTLTEVTYGRRRKELYGFGAGTGAGKTEGFKEIIQHIITHDNLPVGLFFLEEHPALTAKVIAGKIANKKFHVPDAGWTPEELEHGINLLKDKVYLYNHFGQKDWNSLRSKMRYMVVNLGIKDIFLDHLTALVADEDNVNKSLEHIMADMAALTQELDFTLYFISHLTTPQNGPSHEEGGRVTVSQFRGSRTIGFWSHFIFGYERDQQAEDVTERNSVVFRVLKDRYTGRATGSTFKLFYNQITGRFLEDTITEF